MKTIALSILLLCSSAFAVQPVTVHLFVMGNVPAGTAADWNMNGSLAIHTWSNVQSGGSYQWGPVNFQTGIPISCAFHVQPQNDVTASQTVTAGITDYYFLLTWSGGGNQVIPTAPVITVQPANATVNDGQNASFSVTATYTGDEVLLYQWYRNGVAIVGGAYSSIFSITDVQTSKAGAYTVTVFDSVGAVTSNAATLANNPAAPFASAPANVSTNVGLNANMICIPTGTEPITIQWYAGASPVVGATAAIMTLPNVQISQAGPYHVALTNSAGNSSSGAGTLTVTQPPIITSALADQSVNAGGNLTLSITVTGDATLLYQWYSLGSPISWATNASMTITNVSTANGGFYLAYVSNASGRAWSGMYLTVIGPPVFTLQPLGTTNVVGGAVSLKAVVTGTAPIAYRWQLNGTSDAAMTNANLSFLSGQLTNSGTWTLVATNSAGTATSSNAAVLIMAKPVITVPPVNATVSSPNPASFTVTATGTSLAYQWLSNGVALADGGSVSGSQTATLSINPTTVTWTGYYSVTVSNTFGTATAPAYLTVNGPPIILVQPASQTNIAGSTLNLSVTGAGTLPIHYQWIFGASPITNANANTYQIIDIQQANAGNYSVVLTNVYGSVTSSNAAITVTDGAPAITANPTNATILNYSTATFGVSSTGTEPKTYSWLFGSTPVGTNQILTISNAVASVNGGNYSVVVGNGFGNVTSTVATLTISTPLLAPLNFIVTCTNFLNPANSPQIVLLTDGLGTVFNDGVGVDPNTVNPQNFASAQNGHVGDGLIAIIQGESQPWAHATQMQRIAQGCTNYYFFLDYTGSSNQALPSPFIISQPPSSLVAYPGTNAIFNATVGGLAGGKVQWYFNGVPIVGATTLFGSNTTYEVFNAQPKDSGTYTAVFTAPWGSSANSSAGVLTVGGGAGTPAGQVGISEPSGAFK